MLSGDGGRRNHQGEHDALKVGCTRCAAFTSRLKLPKKEKESSWKIRALFGSYSVQLISSVDKAPDSQDSPTVDFEDAVVPPDSDGGDDLALRPTRQTTQQVRGERAHWRTRLGV